MQNRRRFLKRISIGALMVNSIPTILLSKNIPVKKNSSQFPSNYLINIVLNGKGKMGTSNVRTALSVGGVKMVAVCDLFDRRLEDARSQWGNNIFITKNDKEILSRKDIDAVIIAPPNYWHQPIIIEEINAEKHVYCEKPVISKLKEGKALIKAQSEGRMIFQVGSQGMSSLGNRAARLLIKTRLIGRVNFIDGIRNNTPVPGDVLFAVRSSAPVILSYESYFTNRVIQWNAQKLQILK